MLAMKYLLIASAVGLLISAAAVLAFDAYRTVRSLVPPPIRWRLASRLALLAWLPLLPALSIVVVPSGMAGVRVSQISGTLAGTMYPGTHFIVPLIHHVELFTTRDQIFEAHRATAADEPIRRTIASSFDRSAICRVLLQDFAEPADAILPRWLSGYELFVLSRPDRRLSRSDVTRLPLARRALTLRVDAADPVAKSIAERIAVDAREAGFTLTVQAPAGLAPRPDIRLLRVPLTPATPERALAAFMATLGPRTLTYVTGEPAPALNASLPEVHRVERDLLERSIIVPIVHVPEIYGLGERLDWWNGPVVTTTATWDLANVWLRASAP
jgi:hypothetical protein